LRGQSFHKDCCRIVYSGGDIYEANGCLAKGGCDAIIVDNQRRRILLVEGKCRGRISADDAGDVIGQLRRCKEWLRERLGPNFGGYEVIYVVLHGSRRVERYAIKRLEKEGRGKLGYPIQRKRSDEDLSKLP